MELLITRAEIQKYKQVSKTGYDDVLNASIREAQLLDLQPLLGESFFNLIQANPNNYTDLLNGGQYSYNNITYTNNGVKMVLAYFAYARYTMFGSAIDTPFSFVEKLNENSRPVETTTKKSIYQLNRESAFQLWDSVDNYLVRNKIEGYGKNCHTVNRTTGMRFTKIG